MINLIKADIIHAKNMVIIINNKNLNLKVSSGPISINPKTNEQIKLTIPFMVDSAKNLEKI